MPIMLPLLLLALALLAAAAPAGAAEERDTVTLTTSLGALDEKEDTRPLRARGKVPEGSRLVVRYYRGSKRIATTRPRPRKGRYRSDHEISKTGAYTVKVTATTRSGERIRVSAKLRYTPKAKAPTAPDDTEG